MCKGNYLNAVRSTLRFPDGAAVIDVMLEHTRRFGPRNIRLDADEVERILLGNRMGPEADQ
jgi:hypothetical protein